MEAAGPLAKNIGPERTEAIREQLGLGVGDAAFFLAGKPKTFEAVAGRARNVIGEELSLTDKGRFAFAWIVDFPLYEQDAETGKIDFEHNPFSMPQGGMETLNGNPLEVLGYQYDLACNGYEFAKFFLTHSRLCGSALGSFANGALSIVYSPLRSLIMFSKFCAFAVNGKFNQKSSLSLIFCNASSISVICRQSFPTSFFHAGKKSASTPSMST